MSKITNIVLGEHFEQFISRQMHDGHYASANEVIREGLRLLEARETKLATLRAALIDGEQSKFTKGFDLEALNHELDDELE